MNARLLNVAISAAMLGAAITAGSFAWQDAADRKPEAKADNQQPAQSPPSQQGFPDLIGAIKESPGCLGVEVGQMMSGKRVIFSWFEDKDAVKTWYYSEPHQQVMDTFFQERAGDFKPLDGVPDDAGPLLVIASLTMADKAQFNETSLPVSQIAIEIYQPVSGGLFLGGRFAPDDVHVEDMQDYTPKPTTREPATKAQD